MTKKDFTTKKLTYREEMEGELVYESDFGTTVERTDEKMIVKVYADKYQNFMQTADDLWCELCLLSNWLWEREREDKFSDIGHLPALPRDEEEREHRNDMWYNERDPYLYMYFHSTYNWVMYENEEQYLFLYEMPITNMYELAITRQLEALRFWTKDDAGMMIAFLRSWYERANGYADVEEDE